MITEENKAPHQNRLRGNIMLMITAFIWGLAFIAQSVGMDYVGPFTFNFARFVIGGLILIPSLFFLDKMGITRAPEGRAQYKKLAAGGISCGVLLFIASSAQQIGIMTTSAGKTGFITALYIVLVPVIGLFMGNRPSARISVSVLIAMAGMYLLCVDEAFVINRGDIFVLASALFFAFHIVVIDYFAPRVDCVRMSCIQFFVAGALSAAMMFIFEKPDVYSLWNSRIPVLYAGVLSSGVAYTLQIVGQRETKPVIASLILSFESVFAAVAGVIILNESFTYRELAGCALMFIAVLTAQLKDLRKDIGFEK